MLMRGIKRVSQQLIITVITPVIKASEMRRKKQNFFAEECTRIGVKLSKGKLGLVKNDITGYIDLTRSNI